MFSKKQYCQGPEDVSQWVGYLPACNKALCLIPSTIYIRPAYLQPITQKARLNYLVSLRPISWDPISKTGILKTYMEQFEVYLAS